MRQFATLLILLACAGGCTRSGPQRDLPNVLFITLDTLRTDCLTHEGPERRPSPNLDRIIAEGTFFTEHRAVTGWTVPSHSTIFTGRSVRGHGASSNRHVLSLSELTLAEVLAAEGYHTAAVTTGPLFSGCYMGGIDQGFANYNNQPIEVREHCRELQDPPREKLLRKPELVQKKPSRFVQPKVRWGDIITAEGLEILAQPREEPLFLWLHYYDMHDPYMPGEEHADGKLHEDWENLPPEQADELRRFLYHQQLIKLDEYLGAVFTALEAQEMMDNTLIVIVGDHGESLGEDDLFGHGNLQSEAILRTPLIIRWPGKVPGGQRIDTIVGQQDVFPTVCGLLRLPIPPSVEGSPLPLRREAESVYRKNRPSQIAENELGELAIYLPPYKVHVDPPGEESPHGQWAVEDLATAHLGHRYDLSRDPMAESPLPAGGGPGLPEVQQAVFQWRQRITRESRPEMRRDPGLDDQLDALGYVN